MTAPRLRIVRERRCYSQRELAAISGLNRMTIRHIEAGGDARPQTIRRLADVLRVEPHDLQEAPDVDDE